MEKLHGYFAMSNYERLFYNFDNIEEELKNKYTHIYENWYHSITNKLLHFHSMFPASPTDKEWPTTGPNLKPQAGLFYTGYENDLKIKCLECSYYPKQDHIKLYILLNDLKTYSKKNKHFTKVVV